MILNTYLVVNDYCSCSYFFSNKNQINKQINTMCRFVFHPQNTFEKSKLNERIVLEFKKKRRRMFHIFFLLEINLTITCNNQEIFTINH
mgnify:FL=1